MYFRLRADVSKVEHSPRKVPNMHDMLLFVLRVFVIILLLVMLKMTLRGSMRLYMGPHGEIKISLSFARRLILCLFLIVSGVSLFSLFSKTPIDRFSNTSLNQGGISGRETGKSCSSVVPCTIWMLWDKGWDQAPPMQTICRKSIQYQNPNYEVKALDLAQAEAYINRSQFYSDEAWNLAAIQAKSDIIRVELLMRYGGIWADASVFCNEPFDRWLDKALLPEEFVVYERHDQAVNEGAKPWISSWFIASTTTSKILKIWVDEVRKEWAGEPYPPTVFGYFWIHRIFSRLVRNNNVFRDHYQKVFPLDAGGPHCFNETGPVPHVYKLKVCKAQKEKLIEDFVKANGTDWVPVIH